MDESLEKALKAIVKERGNPLLVLGVEGIEISLPILIDQKLGRRKFEKLDVLLQTGGGDIDGAFNAIRLIRRLTKELTIIVPWYAKSAGTLMCLGADNLILSDISELGPLDTQVPEVEEGEPNYKSALNGTQALEEARRHNFEVLDSCTQLLLMRCAMRISEAVEYATAFAGQTSAVLYEKLDPVKTGEYQRALKIGQQYGEQLLGRYMGWNEDDARTLVTRLVRGYPTHSYVLDVDELVDIGLPAQLADDNLNKHMLIVRNLLLHVDDDTVELIEHEKPNIVKRMVQRGGTHAEPQAQQKAG